MEENEQEGEDEENHSEPDEAECDEEDGAIVPKDGVEHKPTQNRKRVAWKSSCLVMEADRIARTPLLSKTEIGVLDGRRGRGRGKGRGKGHGKGKGLGKSNTKTEESGDKPVKHKTGGKGRGKGRGKTKCSDEVTGSNSNEPGEELGICKKPEKGCKQTTSDKVTGEAENKRKGNPMSAAEDGFVKEARLDAGVVRLNYRHNDAFLQLTTYEGHREHWLAVTEKQCQGSLNSSWVSGPWGLDPGYWDTSKFWI